MKDDKLRELGLKVTMPRLKILQLLEAPDAGHLSAEEVHARLKRQGEEVGLATIYRVLTQFEEAGLVKRHSFEGGYAVFELDHGKHHDHMVCVRCGSVAEFVDPMIENRQQVIADQHQFEMTDHSLIIYGVCHQCGQE